VFANVTVTNSQTQGFLMINPGANTTVASSAIDSSATGQTLANGVVPTLDGAGQITVIAGDVGEDFVSPGALRAPPRPRKDAARRRPRSSRRSP